MPDDDEDARTPAPRPWIDSAIGVATEADRRRDRSLPAPPHRDPAEEGPATRRLSGGRDDAPPSVEERDAALSRKVPPDALERED